MFVGLHRAAVLVQAPLANRKIKTRLQFRARSTGGDRRDTVWTDHPQTDVIKAEVLMVKRPEEPPLAVRAGDVRSMLRSPAKVMLSADP